MTHKLTVTCRTDGQEDKADIEMTAVLTEKARKPLAEAIQSAFTPVRHTIGIEAETDIP
jgi:hypothetical protein